MKHSIRLTGPNGAQTYLSHRGKVAFSPATARKYLSEWLQCNPGGTARIEDQFGDPVENPSPRRNLREQCDANKKHTGADYGWFFDTSGNPRVERVNPSARYPYQYTTA